MIFVGVVGHKFSTFVAKFVLDFVPQFDMPGQIFVRDLYATNWTSFFGPKINGVGQKLRKSMMTSFGCLMTSSGVNILEIYDMRPN